MNSKHLSMLAGAVGLAAAAVPGAANALVSWTFNTHNCVSTVGPSGNCGSGDRNFAAARTYGGTNGAGNVTVSGWANTTGGNTLLERGDVTHYGGSGLGVRNADYDGGDTNEGNVPEHAIDNEDRFDLVLFDFGDQLVQLSAVTLGYYHNDADISVLAYTGEGTPDLTTRTAWAGGEDLTSNGWSLIGNHDVDSGGDLTQEVNPDAVPSSYWLVSAYNPAFGGNCSICQADYEDYFKLLALAGEVREPPVTVTVPEPSTLLLVAGALPLLLRRRAKA